MTRLAWRWMLIVLGMTSVAVAGERCGDWLNVRDFGASGSSFETTAAATAGLAQVTVAEVGDFRVGQGVMLSKCNPHFERSILKPPENPYGSDPLGDAAELRGYDGTSGGWLVFLVEINGADPVTFRWSDDLARTWKGTKVPVTFDWQPLSGGVEIKFKKQAWQPGHMITFHARDLLLSKVEKIEGKVVTLAHPATRTVKDAVLRHCDSEALQAVVARAVRENRNVFLPAGHYRLSYGPTVANAAGIVVEGASGAETVLDISEGNGPCLRLAGVTEVTVRNLRMVGHTGLGDGPGWHSFPTSSGKACWPVGLKSCSAMHIRNTERVLVENCHASKMNCEAFYCQGDSRSGTKEPAAYTKLLTYLRCSATDCDGNGFNNNDLAENTSVLYCRIVRATCGATQVIVRNNLFVNYNSCGIEIIAGGGTRDLPTSVCTITGNLLDMTAVGEIVDPTTFLVGRGTIPLERRQSHRYRGWNVAWFRGGKPAGDSVLESFDPETLRFKLKEPRELKVDDQFVVSAPSANWLIHDNMIVSCRQPVVLGSHGSATSLFRDNLIERGSVSEAVEAVKVTGQFKLIDNHLVGFGEPPSGNGK